MRVGLLADTHDRLPAIAELVRRMAASDVSMVLHAGDYCAPFSLAPFLDANMALGGVFGRNDGDPEGLRAYAQRGMGMELYESPHSFEVGGRRLLLVHDIGEVHQRSIDQHSVVVHGCSHRQDQHVTGDVLVVNPGEASGWLYKVPSAAILDLDARTVEFLTLDGPEWR